MMKHFIKAHLIFLWGVILLLIPVLVSANESNTRTITDMTGHRVMIKNPVNRIITTFKPASLCVLSLGLAQKLVGVDNSSRQDRLQLEVFPEIANLAGVGTKAIGINFETLVSLKPDLVILYSQKEGLSVADRLSAMNIPSIVILPETFGSLKDSLRVIAGAAGEPEKFLRVEKLMDGVINLVTQRLSGLPKENLKTGYFASALGLFNTTTGNMIANEIFDKAGIKNVSSHLSGYFQDISPEQLVKWNPDIMVLSQHFKKGETQRLSDKALKEIKAVSNKAVYRCPSSLAPWDFPSPLSVLATLWIAQKAYPERFADINIKAAADEFHQELFQKTMTQMGGTISDTVD
ncbi:MAG: ABC transporter substrate-binding protein [Desulfobacula sp.]|jgi:iron complex transport system substrate-binding protein